MKKIEEIITERNPLGQRHDVAYIEIVECMKEHAKQAVHLALELASEEFENNAIYKIGDLEAEILDKLK